MRGIAEGSSRVEVIGVTIPVLKAPHAFAARAETNVQGLTVGTGLELKEMTDGIDTLPVTTTGRICMSGDLFQKVAHERA